MPKEWDANAHQLWLEAKPQEAIQALLGSINKYGARKPEQLVLQFAYYLFLLGDFVSGIQVLENHISQTPLSVMVGQNLAVMYARNEQLEQAVDMARRTLALDPANVLANDVLATALHGLGRLEEAAEAGTASLTLKDANAGPVRKGWSLPDIAPSEYAADKKKVIAFSLWGANPRYLRGALQNVLLAPEFYPGWEVRFHVDESVSAEFLSLLEEQGAVLERSSASQPLRHKLCRRFMVADDPSVGYFLVRDADSVFSRREAELVGQWMESGKWFHVIRDWWTHTDLMLAGMWGGVAGVLPSMSGLLRDYMPESVETPNVDQWFLRDRVWAYVRQSCMIHDSCYGLEGTTPIPGGYPSLEGHIGHNEYSAHHREQAELLAGWIEKFSCLTNG
ncbi:tetratricopeptide repeat protein [Pseudodesulfovibrio sp. zrk46]|nr:tetratricopeptide repeat protein [Pseudodesulfovibrio sp. zrk46]